MDVQKVKKGHRIINNGEYEVTKSGGWYCVKDREGNKKGLFSFRAIQEFVTGKISDDWYGRFNIELTQ